jgi:hypothetical protein
MCRLELGWPFCDNLLNVLFSDAEGEHSSFFLYIYVWVNEHILEIAFK